MQEKVESWLRKISHYHWSPKPPSEYVLGECDNKSGIGLVAPRNPGSFNLTWSCVSGNLGTRNDHIVAVAFFSAAEHANQFEVKGIPLEEWLTTYQKAEYIKWYGKVRHTLPQHVIKLHDQGLHLGSLRDLRKV